MLLNKSCFVSLWMALQENNFCFRESLLPPGPWLPCPVASPYQAKVKACGGTGKKTCGY